MGEDHDDSDDAGGLAPAEGLPLTKSQKRKARKLRAEQLHGGRDPTLPSNASLRHERRARSLFRFLYDGEEENLHLIIIQ